MLYIDFGVGMASGLNGVGLRAVELATAFSAYTDVTILVPDTPQESIRTVWPGLRWAHPRQTTPTAADVYWYGFATSPRTIQRFRAAHAVCVFDAIVWPLEYLTYETVRTAAAPHRAYQTRLADHLRRLRAADKFTVASRTERQVVVGMLSCMFWSPLGHLAPDLDSRFFLLPVGLSARNENTAAQADPSGENGLTLVWNGGTWNHYNPEAAVRAVLHARTSGLNVRLRFLYPQRGTVTTALRAAYTAAGGCEAIDFADQPLDMTQRVGILRTAAAAICTYPPHALWDLCPPMRLRETLLYHLPMIAPRRGALGDLIAQHCFGQTVNDTSPHELADAINVVADPQQRQRMSRAVTTILPQFLYENRAGAAWDWMTDGTFNDPIRHDHLRPRQHPDR